MEREEKNISVLQKIFTPKKKSIYYSVICL